MDLTPEPERFKIGPCDWTTHPNVDVGPDTQFCVRCGRVRFPSSEDRPCRALRELAAAYRAGREDAAKANTALLDALRRLRDHWYGRPGWTDAGDTVDVLIDAFAGEHNTERGSE